LEDSGISSLIASLENRDHLSAEEKAALEALNWRFRDFPRGTEIIRDRSRPAESCLIVQGYGVRAGYLRSGQRQLTALLVPGDFADLHGLLLKVMDHSVIALTDCRIGFVDHAALRRLSADHPHLWRLFTLLLTIDASIQRTWLVSIGRRNPASHLAHLICETHLRLLSVGRALPDAFDLPIGQADLADLLGLSVVHTNRTLQELRAQNLVRWRGGTVQLPDRKALAALAEFDPIYLHLGPERR
jgi:CRP-like cAMP-binding protein